MMFFTLFSRSSHLRAWRLSALLLSVIVLVACGSDVGNSVYRPNVALFDTTACADSPDTPDTADAFDLAAARVPMAVKPVLATSIHESGYGLCMTRLTDHSLQFPAGFARTDYSRRQSFSANDAHLLVIDDDGAWHLYNPNTASYVKRLPALVGAAEPHWNPVHANLLSFLPQTGSLLQLHQLDVLSGEVTVQTDLSTRIRALWPEAAVMNTGAEGSPSADNRFWAFQISDSVNRALGMVVWDAQLDSLIASLTINRLPDHLSMSPSGDFVVVSWPDETVAFTRFLVRQHTLQRSTEHSDIAIGLDGDDYYVSVDYAADNGDLFMVHLPTGVRTSLLPTYLNRRATTLHVSGKAYDKPGWIVLSTFSRHSVIPEWLYQRVWVVQLARVPLIYPIAFHQSVLEPDLSDDNYWAEPQAGSNRDLTMVTMNSNWGSSSVKNVDVYKLDVPEIPEPL